MFTLKRKNKAHIVMEIKDYILRIIIVKGADVSQWQKHEAVVPKHVIDSAMIIDEMALFEFLKENFKKWGIKKMPISFFVPDTSVLLRTFTHPEELKSSELKGYVEMELGHSIHLPFANPLIDVYDPRPEDNEAIIFAAPSEEVMKLIGIMQDLHLVPKVADVRALSTIRYLTYTAKIEETKTYLIADWSINELSIAIYSAGTVEFLRYQTIETDLGQWKPSEEQGVVTFSHTDDDQAYRMVVTDQVLEIDRIMNFFKFSLHKGEKEVDEIIVLGDNPTLDQVGQFLATNLSTPLTIITDAVVAKDFPQFMHSDASLLGLALKGVKQ